MSNKLDVLVFGASGFTGKFTILQLNKLAKNFTWGIAGRNEEKLKKALVETGKRADNDFTSIPIILANVEDEESIKEMTARAKVLINCCGPYDLHGEIVVKSCIETGTHYVDVTAEIQFVNKMLLKYGDAAEREGVFIVSACGYDCIPTDLGVCFIESKFPGTVNSVETYMRAVVDNSISGGSGNFGTWASAVNYIDTMYNTLFRKPKLDKIKRPAFIPKLTWRLLRRVEDGWGVTFPVADMDIVYRSQQYFFENHNKRPIQMNNYMVVNSFKYVIIGFFLMVFSIILGQFKCGRKILLKYPGFFTNGYITKDEPPLDKITQTSFSMTLKCEGWTDQLPGANGQYLTAPNKRVIGRIGGDNPGYGFTSVAVTLCALIILTEKSKLPPKGGVYTPAIAFSKTSLIQQLQDNGVVFEVLSTNDI